MTVKTFDHGDRAAALNGEILRGLVGSTAHGINLPGTDDRDEMGVYVEPLDNVLGTFSPLDSFQSRTQPDGARSHVGDVDLMMYSLRHFMRLAASGNPSILVLFYTPQIIYANELGTYLKDVVPSFVLSQKAGWRFLGYLNAQRDRMIGRGKKSRVPNRPELVEKFGYDTKYASHALRLGFQGVQLMENGLLKLPMWQSEQQVLLDMRTGKYSFDEALELIDDQRNKLQTIMYRKTSLLPDEPNYYVLHNLMHKIHTRFWNGSYER